MSTDMGVRQDAQSINPSSHASVAHQVPDARVDMFSTQGFALAQRIANAFASSNAVPEQFRSHTLKKNPSGDQWVENPSSLGNCIVAIEVAQAVGMSITAVMQNADVIEGKLRWSGKFVIAAINRSGRFTPLRFNMRNLGRITAAYKEKTGWDKENRRPIFAERSIEIDNEECICWALPRGFQTPPGIYTLDQVRAAGLPVIESAPVTMQMVVEEGWYAKSGSKWQTGMKALMFQYRAGSFFGNIHAPDIVMGMGRTAEEERDVVDLHQQPDGTFAQTAAAVRAATGSTDKLKAAIGKRGTKSAKEPPPPAAGAPAAAREPDDMFTEDELAAIHEREMAEAAASQEVAP